MTPRLHTRLHSTEPAVISANHNRLSALVRRLEGQSRGMVDMNSVSFARCCRPSEASLSSLEPRHTKGAETEKHLPKSGWLQLSNSRTHKAFRCVELKLMIDYYTWSCPVQWLHLLGRWWHNMAACNTTIHALKTQANIQLKTDHVLPELLIPGFSIKAIR